MRVLNDDEPDATNAEAGGRVNTADGSGSGSKTVDLGAFSGTIDASNVGEIFKGSNDETPAARALTAAIEEANEEERKEYERKAEEARKAADVDIDVAEHTASDPLLESAAGSNVEGSVKVNQEQKDAFCTALINNSRYVEKFSLFGGKVTLTIRSRTLEETDSVEAYLRWMASSGGVNTVTDYSNLVRKVLLTAQVQELNGVRFPELKGPMYMEESEDGRKMPGWVGQLSAWERQSSAMAVAAIRCLTEFEARYWFMVDNSKDTNFWNRGEFTAE